MTEPGHTGQPTPAPLLVSALVALLRWRRLLVVLPAILFVVIELATVLRQKTYEASAAFVPDKSTSTLPGGAAALAAQFGVGIGSQGAGDSPDALGQRLQSDSVLREVVVASLPQDAGHPEARVPLWRLLGIKDSAPNRRVALGVVQLRKRLDVRVDAVSSIVSVSVRLPDPVLADAVLRALLAQLNQATAAEYRERMSAERKFMDLRLLDARQSLDHAEDSLASFMARNRSIDNSPYLTLQTDRLRRAVDMQQQIYVGLVQAVEQAGVEADRNTPSIRMVREPVTPAFPSRRYLLLKGVLAILAGVLLAVGYGAARMVVAGEPLLLLDAEHARALLAHEWHLAKADLGVFVRRSRREAGGRQA